MLKFLRKYLWCLLGFLAGVILASVNESLAAVLATMALFVFIGLFLAYYAFDSKVKNT